MSHSESRIQCCWSVFSPASCSWLSQGCIFYTFCLGQITSNTTVLCGWRKQPFVCSFPFKGMTLNHASWLKRSSTCKTNSFLCGYFQRQISAGIVHAGYSLKGLTDSNVPTERVGSSDGTSCVTHQQPILPLLVDGTVCINTSLVAGWRFSRVRLKPVTLYTIDLG